MKKGIKIHKNKNFNQNRLWILFVAPVILYLLITQIYPLLSALQTSFFASGLGKTAFVGLKNYIDLFYTPKFWDIFKNTFLFTIASIITHMTLALVMTVLLNADIKVKHKKLFQALQLLPWLFPPMIASLFWLLMFQQQMGLVNKILLLVGLSRFAYEWLGNPNTAMIAVVILNTWIGFSFFTLMLHVAVQAIPKSLYEAAEIDGASKRVCFLRITLPFLRPVILTLIVLDAIWTFRVFDQVWILTKGGPIHYTELLSIYTYKVAFNEFNFNRAAAVGGYTLVVLIIFAFIYLKLYSRKDEV
jgi:multiple sugar transport system permease protein